MNITSPSAPLSKLASLIVVILVATATTASAQQKFATPDEAANALAGAVRVNDQKAMLKILGSRGAGIIASEDDAQDAADRARFISAFDAKHRIVMEGDSKATLVLGADDFPFAIPIVRKDGAWQLDTDAGRVELLSRRIGRNELSTIQTCLAYVDAQNEYAEKDRSGAGSGIYAQRFFSQPGQKDGLYWAATKADDESPLGDLFAQATREGYRVGGGRTPYHGYYFKILTKQGPNAPGGSLDYVVRGKMIGGFALVAYPAEYGNSGVMTFLVSHAGTVYEKDLGRASERIAERITAYNPDQTWRKVDLEKLK
jgi:hypothetical protein